MKLAWVALKLLLRFVHLKFLSLRERYFGMKKCWLAVSPFIPVRLGFSIFSFPRTLQDLLHRNGVCKKFQLQKTPKKLRSKKILLRVKAANSTHGKNESGRVRMQEVRFNESKWGERHPQGAVL